MSETDHEILNKADRFDSKRESISPGSYLLSHRFIGIFCIIISAVITIELIWSSQKISELPETSINRAEGVLNQLNGIEISALALVSGLLVAGSFYLGNRIAQIKNQIVLVLIAVAGFFGMVESLTAIESLLHGYRSPQMVIRFIGIWLVIRTLSPIIVRSSSPKESIRQSPQKPVGWSQPPENDWWSKYN